MAMTPGESSNMHRASVLHLLTPPAELAAMRDPTAGVNLMDRHHLYRYEAESGRTLRRGISHFLSPQLQVLIKEKPRIALSEKADFAELLSESPSGRPIQELSIDLLRRSFMIRRRVVTAGVSASASQDEEAAVPGRPPVPPDVPMLEQTTNKLSPAFAKKVIFKTSNSKPTGLECHCLLLRYISLGSSDARTINAIATIEEHNRFYVSNSSFLQMTPPPLTLNLPISCSAVLLYPTY